MAMSDAADPSPDTWTEDGTELEMELGKATERTDAPVLFVDARCVGCGEVSVCNVREDAKDWTPGSTFADRCRICSQMTPHNIVSKLTGLNRKHSRGYLNRGDDGE